LTWFDGRPLLLRSSWFPFDIGAPLLAPEARRSLSSLGAIELMERVLGRRIALAEQRIEAAVADPMITRDLQVTAGHPIFLFEQVVRGTDRRSLELSFSRVRGDRFVLTTLLKPAAPAPAPAAMVPVTTGLRRADGGGSRACRTSQLVLNTDGGKAEG
jgi:DNA-binding GntR family transcriptional regulator